MPLNDPIPSTAADVIEFNVKRIDEEVNSTNDTYTDRFGVQRLTNVGRTNLNQNAIAAFEADGEAAIQALRIVNAGSFEDGATLTARNEVLYYLAEQTYYRWDGALPKTVPPASTPASTGGVGVGAWVNVGQAELASALADPDRGAAMVARGVVAVDSIADLLALPEGQRKEGLRYLVKGYYAGSDEGGGEFYWDADIELSEHNGGTVISPNVSAEPFTDSWYSPSGELGVAGAFVRVFADVLFVEEFGASELGDASAPLESAFRTADLEGCWINSLPGKTYQVSRRISSKSVRADFNGSTIKSSAPIETLVIGETETPSCVTALASSYTPFSGVIAFELVHTVGMQVGDVISVLSDDVFHPNREFVYKRGITTTVTAIHGTTVYVSDEVPFPMSAENSRVISVTPGVCNLKNIRVVGDTDDPSQTRRGIVIANQRSPQLHNVFVDGFGDICVGEFNCVGGTYTDVRTGRSYYAGTSTSYGMATYSSTRTHISALDTHTGRHGFATGAGSKYLPGVASGDERGVPVFGLLVDGGSSIFPELGTSPAAGGGNNGFDCHEGTYSVTIKDSCMYKFQMGANFILFDNARIFGNSGTESLLYFLPEESEGEILFRDTVFEGNGSIAFKGYSPHGTPGSFSGKMRIPKLKFVDCKTAGYDFFLRPTLALGGSECVIDELVLEGAQRILIRDHDLSQVEIKTLKLLNITDRRRGHYIPMAGVTGSRIGFMEVSSCVWRVGHNCLRLDSALVAHVNNLRFDGDDGGYTARIADDSDVFLQNTSLVFGTYNQGVTVVDNGGGGSLRRVASPVKFIPGTSLDGFSVNESVLSD